MASGRNRVLVNRQPLKRARDLLGVLRVTRVRARRPRAGEGRPGRAPALPRRRPRGARTPATTPSAAEVDKVLKQRNALLKGAGGRLDESAALTLDVWDAKLVESGGALAVGPPGPARPARARCWRATYDAVAHGPAEVTAGLRGRLGRRRAWPRRWPRPARTTCAGACPPSGPHRDDLDLQIGGLPGPHPRLPGRAAVAGPGPAPGRPPRDHRRHRHRRRSCCSTTCSPSSTPTAATPSSPTCRPARPCSPAPAACPPKAASRSSVLRVADGTHHRREP